MATMSLTHPEQCFTLLHQLATACEFKTAVSVDMWALGESLGLREEPLQSLVRELCDARLISLVTPAGSICLSPVGLAALNLAKIDPDRPSAYFPALSGFFGLSEESVSPLSRPAVSTLLDQLAACRGLLESRSDVSPQLEHRLGELEQLVAASPVESTSLRQGLEQLRAALAD